MPLRAFEEAAITTVFTITGDFSNAEDGEAAGDTGETITKLLYITMGQRKLDGGIDANQEDIELDYPWFADDGRNFVLFNSGEKGFVTAGWGTTSLTVTRGFHGTTKSSQADGTTFQRCYEAPAGEATIQCVDIDGSDQAPWVTYCLAPGGTPDESYEVELTLKAGGAIIPGEVIIVERKIVVPAAWGFDDKQDLIHRLSGKIEEYSP